MTGLLARLTFANRLADAAGAVVLPHFRRNIAVTDKGTSGLFDPVTAADRDAEEVSRDLIRATYPDDGIVGEELGTHPGTSGFRWIIDPIDGTRAFIAGQPLWGTLIGLERSDKPVLGILDQPFLKERFVGVEGRGELRYGGDSVPLKTRACAHLADAVLCTTHPVAHLDEAERALFTRVESAVRFSRYGGDCYAYGLLALGTIDLVMEARLAYWDIAPIIPIVEAAGGLLTDWSGRPWRPGSNVLAAGDPRVHAEVLALLGSA
jgi:myo-inositol-1(or 4)-monophosphatase